jgi:hypothetical protein
MTLNAYAKYATLNAYANYAECFLISGLYYKYIMSVIWR